MLMDGYALAEHTSSEDAREVSIMSQEFPPAQGYCIRFWYNMFGLDVRNFSAHAQVSPHGDCCAGDGQSRHW